ncbi:MAG: hypothetical protein WBM40_22710, partial [Thiohalocapsa sp.]
MGIVHDPDLSVERIKRRPLLCGRRRCAPGALLRLLARNALAIVSVVRAVAYHGHRGTGRDVFERRCGKLLWHADAAVRCRAARPRNRTGMHA